MCSIIVVVSWRIWNDRLTWWEVVMTGVGPRASSTSGGCSSVPVLNRAIFARGYCNQCLKAAHIVARFRVGRLYVTSGESGIMSSLQSVGVLLRCLYVASGGRKGLESRVSPDRFGFGLGLVLRMERMRSGMYLALIVRAANWHCRRGMCRVLLILSNYDGMVFTTLLGQRRGNAITAAGVLRRWTSKSCRTNRSAVPCLTLVATRCRRLFVMSWRLCLHDLRWTSVDLLDKVARLRWDNLTNLPLAVMWRAISRCDVQTRKILVQSSIRGASRTRRTRLCVDHHWTASRLASSVRWRMVETLNTRKSCDLAGS